MVFYTDKDGVFLVVHVYSQLVIKPEKRLRSQCNPFVIVILHNID